MKMAKASRKREALRIIFNDCWSFYLTEIVPTHREKILNALMALYLSLSLASLSLAVSVLSQNECDNIDGGSGIRITIKKGEILFNDFISSCCTISFYFSVAFSIQSVALIFSC
jgi:hypothetical protein